LLVLPAYRAANLDPIEALRSNNDGYEEIRAAIRPTPSVHGRSLSTCALRFLRIVSPALTKEQQMKPAITNVDFVLLAAGSI